jgi:hypothetical protein
MNIIINVRLFVPTRGSNYILNNNKYNIDQRETLVTLPILSSDEIGE